MPLSPTADAPTLLHHHRRRMAGTRVDQFARRDIEHAIPHGEKTIAVADHREVAIQRPSTAAGSAKSTPARACERSQLSSEIDISAGATPCPQTSSR